MNLPSLLPILLGIGLVVLAIKTVNALSHYTDWTIGHVHAGALGWVAMFTFGSLYHMIPKVFGREQMYSTVPMVARPKWSEAIRDTRSTSASGWHGRR